MLIRLLILVLIAFTIPLKSQERCGFEEITKKRMKENPNYEIAIKKVDKLTKEWVNANPNYSTKTIITIPIVVHVVWRTNTHNISDAQIQSQIAVLNKDYRRTNIDAINTPNVWQTVAADCEIEFCLATIDPNGQPTNGINRVETNHGKFGMNNDIHTSSLGGADDWPNNDYLNIWVCDISDGLLGYATQPSSWIGDGDGLVIGHKYFGTTGTVQPPYNKGRTATHEIGHWLNLKHLWGSSGSCGDDQVNDTPKQETENYSCPGFPQNANSCNTTNANGDMFMNYMDYTNDACMNLFTNDQKTRMHAAINQFRPNMLNHNLCNGATSILETNRTEKTLIKIINIFGKEISNPHKNTTLFYIYNDGSIEKKMIIQ